MSFDINGFLGEQIEDIHKQICQDNKGLLDFVLELNRLAQEIKYKLEIHNEDAQELTIGALYIKTLQSFNSIVILSLRGLESDSKALLRVMLEAAFYLKATCIDDNFVFEYINGDELERFKIINRIVHDKGNVFSEEAKKYATRDKLEELKSKIPPKKDNPLEIHKVAEKAKMNDFYQLVYGHLSADVHTSVRSIEKYYGLDENGKVIYFDCIPRTDSLNVTLSTACSILITILDCCTEFFKLNYTEVLNNKIEWLKEFDKNVVSKADIT